jgi:exopolysaccharide production protein ExoZ
MVVVHHATIMYAERLHPDGFRWLSGAAGVDIFFVISGLVMGLSSEKLVTRSHAAGYFLARRIERIVPLYWLMTTLKILMLLALPGLAVNALGTKWHVVASYLFVPSLNASGIAEPVLVVGWTLSFEMAFYLLFALALSLHIKPVKFLLPVLGAIATAHFFLHPARDQALLTLCSPLVLEFLYGLVLTSVFRSSKFPKPAICWLMLATSFAIIMCTPDAGDTFLRFLIWGLPAAAIVLGALGLESGLKGSIPDWALESGDASYSIYLTHGFALPLVGVLLARLALPHPASLALAILAGLLASAILGELTYRVVERPLIDYFQLRRRTASTEPA